MIVWHILKIFSFFILLLNLSSCEPSSDNSSDFKNEKSVSVRDQFITKHVLKNDGGNFIVVFIFPSFCGACSKPTMDFIDELNLKGYEKVFVIPKEDSNQISYFNLLPEQTIVKFDKFTLQRNGFRGSTNIIMLVNASVITFESQITEETVPGLRQKIIMQK